MVTVNCPSCGSEKVKALTRIVGYTSFVSNWNNNKVEELKDRQKGDYSITPEEERDIECEYGEEMPKITLYAKPGCQPCGSLERIAKHLLEKNGLAGKVKLEKKYITDENGKYNVDNFAELEWMGGSRNMLPYFAATDKKKLIVSAGTKYGDGALQMPRQEIEDVINYFSKSYAEAKEVAYA